MGYGDARASGSFFPENPAKRQKRAILAHFWAKDPLLGGPEGVFGTTWGRCGARRPENGLGRGRPSHLHSLAQIMPSFILPSSEIIS